LLTWSAAVAAIPVASEPFAYNPGALLNGQNGGAGFSGPWVASGFNASLHDNYAVEGGSLGGTGLSPAGGRIASAAVPQIAGLGRSLEPSILATDTVTVYWSFLLRPEGVMGGGAFNGFFGLYLDGTANGGNADLFAGKPGSSAQADYALEGRGGSGQVSSGVPAAIGQTALLVVRGDFTPGLDRFTLHVNPDPCEAEPSGGTVKDDMDLGDVSAIVIYSTGAFSLDEVHMGPSFLGVLTATGLDCNSPPVVNEPFAYAPGRTNLNGRDGGTGFAGPWSPSGFNASLFDNNTVQAGSLTVPGLAPVGHRAEALATTAIAGLGRNLQTPIHAGSTLTVYWSFLLRPEGVLGGGAFNGFFGLYLDGTADGGNADLFAGKPGSSAQADYVLEARGGAGQVSSGVPAAIGQTALLVVRGDFTPGLDRFTLHVNPDPCEAEPSGGAVKDDLDLGDVSAIVIYSTGAFSLDEIHMGPSYSSVLDSTGLDCAPPASPQLPGDCNQDGELDISDAVCLLGFLFLGTIDRLPCGDGRATDLANIALLDANGDHGLDLSDAVSVLSFLFLGGPPPAAGTECTGIEGCPAVDGCPQ
jgi:hypothetical protein